MLVTQGGRFGGYGLYLLKGKPVFLWNLLDLKRVRWEGTEALAPGKHTLEFDFNTTDSARDAGLQQLSGIGRPAPACSRWTARRSRRKTMERTVPLILPWDETFDVGVDTGTPVDDKTTRCRSRSPASSTS